MSTDLERFRDHCRKMAGPPVAPGCPAAAARALWVRLAEEVDAYLAADDQAPSLFEATSTPRPPRLPPPPRRYPPLPDPVVPSP